MPKISNATLAAERKGVLALVEAEKGESTADAVARALREKDEELERLKVLLKANGEALLAVEAEAKMARFEDAFLATKPTPEPPGPDVHIGPHPGMAVDTAVYLKPGQSLPPPPPGIMTAQLGDMTPGYAEWLLENGGPDEVKRVYMHGTTTSRVHLLPPAVQAALK